MNIVIGIALIIVGTLSTLFPDRMNSMDNWFFFKKVKPSQSSVKVYRIAGLTALVTGIYVLVSLLFE
jgi:uncharacterized membrane protein HdeD (DUF308 family)